LKPIQSTTAWNWLLLQFVFDVSFCWPSQSSALQRKTACSQPKALIYTIVAEFCGPLLNVFCCKDFSFWYGKWGGPTKKTTFCKNYVAVEIFLERPQDWSFYRTRVRSLAMLVSDSLTDWLTHSCLVNSIDVTLACEDLNSKLGEVQKWANSVLMTEYEYEYYSSPKKWPNTNTNIIRLSKTDRIRIRILFGLPKMTEYEYEYYSAPQKRPNTNTNIIRLSKNDRIRIRILLDSLKTQIIFFCISTTMQYQRSIHSF